MTLLAVMKAKGKITAFAQHIIDIFRTLYSEEGISGRKFSRAITEDSNPTRVGNIESEYNNDKYPPQLISKALNYFGKTMQDILPEELLDDDILLEKTKIPVLKQMSIKAALNSLINEGYFDEPRLRNEIRDYYNSFLPKEHHKSNSSFSASLEDLCNKGKLLKILPEEQEAKTTELIRFIRNPNFKEE